MLSLPDDFQAREPGWQKGVRLGLVVGLHLAFGLALLVYRFEPEIRSALTSVEVRLLPQAPESLPEPPKPKPPLPAPRAPVARVQPVLTAQAAPVPGNTSSFVVAAQPAPSPPSPALAPAVAAPLPVTAARFDADYLQNPPPSYPAVSRRLGEEGRVVLQVLVSAEGSPERVEVKTSSQFSRLDAAAIDAVRRWRFVPARRGDEAVAASVLVPLVFRLDQ